MEWLMFYNQASFKYNNLILSESEIAKIIIINHLIQMVNTNTKHTESLH